MTRLRQGVIASSGHVPPATFRNAIAYQFSSTTPAFAFTGMAAGDLAIIYTQCVTSLPLTPAGWNFLRNDAWGASSFAAGIFWKVLTAGDISTGSVAFSGADAAGCGMIVAYSGATTPTFKTATTSLAGDATLVQTGFAKNASSRGVLSLVIDRDTPSAFSPPGAFAARIAASAQTNFTVGAYDELSGYVDNATVTFTGFAAVAQQHGVLIELT